MDDTRDTIPCPPPTFEGDTIPCPPPGDEE